jgi:glycyl-tRNA synthetase beta subunit
MLSERGFDILLTGYRRAANILKIEEKKDKREYRGVPDGLRQEEEQELQASLVRAKVETAKALHAEDFAGAMTALAALRVPVDRFFDKVTVNTDDKTLRENRLMLLSQIVETAHQVADFSKVEASPGGAAAKGPSGGHKTHSLRRRAALDGLIKSGHDKCGWRVI